MIQKLNHNTEILAKNIYSVLQSITETVFKDKTGFLKFFEKTCRQRGIPSYTNYIGKHINNSEIQGLYEYKKELITEDLVYVALMQAKAKMREANKKREIKNKAITSSSKISNENRGKSIQMSYIKEAEDILKVLQCLIEKKYISKNSFIKDYDALAKQQKIKVCKQAIDSYVDFIHVGNGLLKLDLSLLNAQKIEQAIIKFNAMCRDRVKKHRELNKHYMTNNSNDTITIVEHNKPVPSFTGDLKGRIFVKSDMSLLDSLSNN